MCIASHPFPASETVQSPKQTCLRPTVAPPPSPRFHAATYVLLRTAHGFPPYLQLTTTPVRDTPACLYLIRDPRYVHFLVIMSIDRSLSPMVHLLGGSGRRHSDVRSLCVLCCPLRLGSARRRTRASLVPQGRLGYLTVGHLLLPAHTPGSLVTC